MRRPAVDILARAAALRNERAYQLLREALHVIGGPDTDVDHRDWCRAARAFVEGTTATARTSETARIKATVIAVLHQIQHGEASDLIGRQDSDVGADLRWCRDQLAQLLISPDDDQLFIDGTQATQKEKRP